MTHQLSHLIACMNSHFASDEQLPADCETWRHLRRHIVRMQNALTLVYLMLRDERELGIPLTADTARKLEGYARWGSCDSTPPAAGPERSSCKNVGSPLRGGTLLIALLLGRALVAERSESRRAVRYDHSIHIFFDRRV